MGVVKVATALAERPGGVGFSFGIGTGIGAFLTLYTGSMATGSTGLPLPKQPLKTRLKMSIKMVVGAVVFILFMSVPGKPGTGNH